MVQGRAKPVLLRPNRTGPKLFHHGETTYRVLRMSEYATGMLSKKDVWIIETLRKLRRSHVYVIPILHPNSFVRDLAWSGNILRFVLLCAKGASIFDVRKLFWILDTLPLCPHLGLIYSTKFKQPPLLHLLLG